MITSQEARKIREENLPNAIKRHTEKLIDEVFWQIRKRAHMGYDWLDIDVSEFFPEAIHDVQEKLKNLGFWAEHKGSVQIIEVIWDDRFDVPQGVKNVRK